MKPRSILEHTVWIAAALVLALGAAPIVDATPSNSAPEKEAIVRAGSLSLAVGALRPGAIILSVDGESAASVDHVLAALERARKGERPGRLRVLDGGGTRFLVLRLD